MQNLVDLKVIEPYNIDFILSELIPISFNNSYEIINTIRENLLNIVLTDQGGEYLTTISNNFKEVIKNSNLLQEIYKFVTIPEETIVSPNGDTIWELTTKADSDIYKINQKTVNGSFRKIAQFNKKPLGISLANHQTGYVMTYPNIIEKFSYKNGKYTKKEIELTRSIHDINSIYSTPDGKTIIVTSSKAQPGYYRSKGTLWKIDTTTGNYSIVDGYFKATPIEAAFTDSLNGYVLIADKPYLQKYINGKYVANKYLDGQIPVEISINSDGTKAWVITKDKQSRIEEL